MTTVGRITIEALFAPLPPIKWVCQGLELAPGPATILGALGGAGKTFLAQDLALAVATGTAAWEAFECSSGKVLHLDYEQGARLTAERYQRLARARGIAPEQLKGLLDVIVYPETRIDADESQEWLSRESEGASLVIVDSFRAAATGTKENESEAREPLDMLGRVSENTGAAFLVLAHARKPGEGDDGPSRFALRGSSALFDAAQSVIIATPATPERTNHEGELMQPAQPPMMLLTKARITGDLWERPITFGIDDVEIDGNPRAGVAVHARKPAAKLSLQERVVDLLKFTKEGPLTANAIKEQLSCSGSAVKHVLSGLKIAGSVVEIPTIVRGNAQKGYALANSK
jgi:hypothetical protein